MTHSYYESNKTSLKNTRKQKQKRNDPPDNEIMEIELEKEDCNNNKKKVKIRNDDKNEKRDKTQKMEKAKSVYKSKEFQNEEDSLPNKFTLKNEDGNERIYSFHRKAWDHYDLRCLDRHCKGTAKYIISTDKVIINNKYTIINFNDHNYIKKISATIF